MVAILIVGAAVLAVQRWTLTLEPRLHRELEAWLSDRLHADVTLERVDVQLFPRITADARALTIRIRNRPDLPPFITIGQWSGNADLSPAGIRHFTEVRLSDVTIRVPPRRLDDIRGPRPPDQPRRRRRPPQFRVDRLVADRLVIEVASRDAARDPHAWDVRDLLMEPFSFDVASPFSATVDTPLPSDRAVVNGVAGPWPDGSFRDLPLEGRYRLEGDLARVAGLVGRLVVEGRALGTLERLATQGTARVAQAGFRAEGVGTLPLVVDYEAVVDATKSDVVINKARATAGGAIVEASGHVVKHKGTAGRHVQLTVRSPSRSNAGDLLRLFVDGSRPPISGTLGLTADVDLRPGTDDVLDRLSFSGTFTLEGARFANAKIQHALDELSNRGLGRPKDASLRVPASIRGAVRLQRRQLGVRQVTLTVPGARIDAAGRYSLKDQSLGFHGIARLDARLSRTQSGLARVLLRPLDPFFARDSAGARVVLDVRGTRQNPVVDIDLGASLRGRR
jgi:hypothetical protein